MRLFAWRSGSGLPVVTFVDTPGRLARRGLRGARPGGGHRALDHDHDRAAHADRDRHHGRGRLRRRAGHRRGRRRARVRERHLLRDLAGGLREHPVAHPGGGPAGGRGDAPDRGRAAGAGRRRPGRARAGRRRPDDAEATAAVAGRAIAEQLQLLVGRDPDELRRCPLRSLSPRWAGSRIGRSRARGARRAGSSTDACATCSAPATVAGRTSRRPSALPHPAAGCRPGTGAAAAPGGRLTGA